MKERPVTVGDVSSPLLELFFVILARNSRAQLGTLPLPKSRLDRVLMRIEHSYPDPIAERILLDGQEGR